MKIAIDQQQKITAMQISYYFNSGAYADYAVNVSRAAAISCTGPYYVPNITCDSLCVYTNMPFSTAYRGFGHIEMGFAIERAICNALSRAVGKEFNQIPISHEKVWNKLKEAKFDKI